MDGADTVTLLNTALALFIGVIFVFGLIFQKRGESGPEVRRYDDAFKRIGERLENLEKNDSKITTSLHELHGSMVRLNQKLETNTLFEYRSNEELKEKFERIDNLLRGDSDKKGVLADQATIFGELKLLEERDKLQATKIDNELIAIKKIIQNRKG